MILFYVASFSPANVYGEFQLFGAKGRRGVADATPLPLNSIFSNMGPFVLSAQHGAIQEEIHSIFMMIP